MTVMAILSWVVFGLAAGLVARMLNPGTDALGTWATILLGVAGAFAGGYVASLLDIGPPSDGQVWSLTHFLVAVCGSIFLLAIYNIFVPVSAKT